MCTRKCQHIFEQDLLKLIRSNGSKILLNFSIIQRHVSSSTFPREITNAISIECSQFNCPNGSISFLSIVPGWQWGAPGITSPDTCHIWTRPMHRWCRRWNGRRVEPWRSTTRPPAVASTVYDFWWKRRPTSGKWFHYRLVVECLLLAKSWWEPWIAYASQVCSETPPIIITAG